MHTEQQATELWCPMVRAANGHMASNCAVNVAAVEGSSPHWQTCIASRCAMWRWSESAPARQLTSCQDRDATTEPPRPFTVPADWEFCPAGDDHACWVEPDAAALARRTGYCGLAGQGFAA